MHPMDLGVNDAKLALLEERNRLLDTVAERRDDYRRKRLTADRTGTAAANASERLSQAEAELARVTDALCVYDPFFVPETTT